MYFWNIKKLKSELAEKSLTEHESLKYLVVNLFLFSIWAVIPQPAANRWDIILGIITVAITMFGTIYMYRCNKGAHGINFLQKYLSLSWVYGIRWTVLTFIPVLIVYWIIVMMFMDTFEQTTWHSTAVFSLLFAQYYYRLGKHVADVAK